MSDGRKSKAGRGFLKATAKLLKKAGKRNGKIAKIANSAEINSAKRASERA